MELYDTDAPKMEVEDKYTEVEETFKKSVDDYTFKKLLNVVKVLENKESKVLLNAVTKKIYKDFCKN